MTRPNEKAYWAAVRSDSKTFLRQAFETIYPGKEFMDNWHIDAILHALVQGFEGKLPRLIVNLPPRHLKSFIISVAWPAFILGQDPSAKIICVSYSDELVKVLARDFRRLMESEWYRKVFANVVLKKLTEGEAVTDQGGGRYAISVGGSLTGRGGDFIIIDDPLKPEDALSDKARQTNNEWFKSTLLSRLDDKERSVLILVMQRLHVNDLTGYIEASGFKKLSFPAIALGDERIAVGDGLYHERAAGEPLQANRENLPVLEKIRAEMGAQYFSAQYQQRPDAPEGALFKRKYLGLVECLPHPDPYGRWWVSIDSAASTSETADYSAITLGYSDPSGHYIVRCDRGRWDFEELLAKAKAYVKKFPEIAFIVEAASTGTSLILALRKLRLRVYHHNPSQDKMARAARVLPIFAEDRVFILNLPPQNAWVAPLINELLSFPFGRFDDQVDSVVQAVYWAERHVNGGGRVIWC
jgi:predicted phage terminase large subunit-like protein